MNFLDLEDISKEVHEVIKANLGQSYNIASGAGMSLHVIENCPQKCNQLKHDELSKFPEGALEFYNSTVGFKCGNLECGSGGGKYCFICCFYCIEREHYDDQDVELSYMASEEDTEATLINITRFYFAQKGRKGISIFIIFWGLN